jgi:glyoxylase-like metal-dependent hydrolase (beta-lactamase superfamily II)
MRDLRGPIRNAIGEVLDPAKLAYVVLLHWEGDENGGMDQFMREAPKSELIGLILSIQLNANGFGLAERARGFRDGETLDLGSRKLRFVETPHVHHWDSMMVVDEKSRVSFRRICLFNPPNNHPLLQRISRCQCSICIARLESSHTNYRFARLSIGWRR